MGSVGPLVYDDADTYPDAVAQRAFRGPQLYIDNAPADPNEVVRLSDITTDGPATTVEDETTFGISPDVGTGTKFARDDHTHGTPGIGWEDLRVPLETTKVGASAPDFDTFIGSTKIYWFDAGTDQEVHFSVQLPHSWNCGQIVPHVHWVPKTTSDGTPANQVVRWGLEYYWANRGVVFAAGLGTTIYTTTHAPADADVVALKHYVSAFAGISPTTDQDEISSMIICRLFRDANDAADTYEHDAGVLEIDFHYQVSSLGSASL